MGVPAADVGKGGFDAEIGFEKLGDLLHAVAEWAVGVVGAGGRDVLCGVGGVEHLDGFEGLVPAAWSRASLTRRTWIRRRWRWGPAADPAADGEVLHIADGDGGDFACEGAGNIRAEGHGAEGGCGWCGRARASSACRARLSQPSGVVLIPGVPDSMKSCASKCERRGVGRAGRRGRWRDGPGPRAA